MLWQPFSPHFYHIKDVLIKVNHVFQLFSCDINLPRVFLESLPIMTVLWSRLFQFFLCSPSYLVSFTCSLELFQELQLLLVLRSLLCSTGFLFSIDPWTKTTVGTTVTFMLQLVPPSTSYYTCYHCKLHVTTGATVIFMLQLVPPSTSYYTCYHFKLHVTAGATVNFISHLREINWFSY